MEIPMSRIQLTTTLSVIASGVLFLGAPPAQAQDVKVNALVDVWYNQILDSNLRTNTPAKYYSLNSAFQEDSFTIRRSEIYIAGKISDEITYNVVIDPNIATPTAPNILHDAFITYKPTSWFSLQAGQFKPLQTYEATLVGANGLYFYDRSQLARVIGDKRDRGFVAGFGFGSADDFAGKFSLGFTNGTTDKDGGKSVDSNAQKDLISRLEFSVGKTQKFGIYGRWGSTDAKDAGALNANAFTYAGTYSPANAEILDNKDKTTNLGVYYVLDNEHWIAQFEAVTGLLGRRYPSVGIAATGTPAVASPAGREYLDQKYLAYVLSGGYKFGQHAIVARYDYFNYNQGDKFYGPNNPYTQNTTTGVLTGADYSPKFTEVVLGWNYTFTPTKWTQSNFKLDYIHRSKNFLKANAALGQTSEQGGDNIVAAFQVAF
jgi:hypothetical protein